MSVCVLGSINIDVILSVARLPASGETVLARDATRLPGGKGANQAVAAARMGAATRMIGAVGSDQGGAWMRDILSREGVDVSAIETLDARQTGAAYIAVEDASENLIIVAPGANAAVATAGSLVPDSGVLLSQLEIPLATVAAAFSRVGPLRILNAAPAIREASAMFSNADILIVNQHELGVYLGGPAIANPDAALAARKLLSRPGQLVIVTLGAQGAVAVWTDRVFHAPAFPVTPIDTVGAGDCFCGALSALLSEGQPVEQALPLANAAAALATQARGAIPAMPTRAAAEAFATEHAPAIKT
jgi:ribokinase